jgi:osmotically-inducible protein OsmY
MKNFSLRSSFHCLTLVAVAISMMACEQKAGAFDWWKNKLMASSSATSLSHASAASQRLGMSRGDDDSQDRVAGSEPSTSEVMVGKLSDAVISMSIHGALLADPHLSSLKIGVDARHGLVLLTGTAPDAVSRDHASVLASRVDGVVAVDNRIALAAPP